MLASTILTPVTHTPEMTMLHCALQQAAIAIQKPPPRFSDTQLPHSATPLPAPPPSQLRRVDEVDTVGQGEVQLLKRLLLGVLETHRHIMVQYDRSLYQPCYWCTCCQLVQVRSQAGRAVAMQGRIAARLRAHMWA